MINGSSSSSRMAHKNKNREQRNSTGESEKESEKGDSRRGNRRNDIGVFLFLYLIQLVRWDLRSLIHLIPVEMDSFECWQRLEAAEKSEKVGAYGKRAKGNAHSLSTAGLEWSSPEIHFKYWPTSES